jgi:hypothetical protein
MDTQPKLPALSGMNRDTLLSTYQTELGHEAAADLNVEELRDAIKARRDANPSTTQTDKPAVKAAASKETAATTSESVPAGHIRVVSKETGLPHVLPLPVWENLGPEQENFSLEVEKPAELK